MNAVGCLPVMTNTNCTEHDDWMTIDTGKCERHANQCKYDSERMNIINTEEFKLCNNSTTQLLTRGSPRGSGVCCNVQHRRSLGLESVRGKGGYPPTSSRHHGLRY